MPFIPTKVTKRSTYHITQSIAINKIKRFGWVKCYCKLCWKCYAAWIEPDHGLCGLTHNWSYDEIYHMKMWFSYITRRNRVTHICSKERSHYFRYLFGAKQTPSHYLKQRLLLLNGPFGMNIREIWIKLEKNWYTEICLKISPAKRQLLFSAWFDFDITGLRRNPNHKRIASVVVTVYVEHVTF